MSHPDVTISFGLPDRYRRRAAEIYWDAFERKFRPILKRERGVPLLARILDPHCAILAFDEDRLVGIAGLHIGSRQFVRWSYRPLIHEFGLVGGLIRGFFVNLANRPQRSGELLMDGLAVDASMRGRGVGSALLEAVCNYAQERGFSAVRLDVVDTNPRARQLYERQGFVPTETHQLPFLRNLLGFGAYTTMIKAVI